MVAALNRLVSLTATVMTLLDDSVTVPYGDNGNHTVITAAAPRKELYGNRRRLIVGGIVMLLGVLGNSWALYILARKKATKNSKYTLMLRCLATNNLVALVGMIVSLLLKVYVPEDILQEYRQYDCSTIVVWRFFGLSSGCIAAVMAIERWMALARPFIYHKHITYELIRKSIKLLVFCATIITFLPFVGFGAYYEIEHGTMKCLRYRDAEGLSNKMYAVLFMLFGSLLCFVIVGCNLFVARVLCFIGRTRTTKRHMHYDLVSREKGGSCRGDNESNSSGSTLFTQHPQQQQQSQSQSQKPPQYHHSNSVTLSADASPDEIKFARLMFLLSISFVVCWMPQMIAIPLAIKPNRVPKDHPFFMIADIMMALHFTSDPYVYVLSRSKQTGMFSCFRRWRGGVKRSQSLQSRRTMTVEHTMDCNFN